jgi:hypothetical protein
MSGIGGWVSETFSSDSSEDDLIQNRSLNITRISGVIAPLLLGATTVIGEIADKPPWNDAAFQRQLLLVVVVVVGAIVVADLLARAWVSASVHRSEELLATVLPGAVPATLELADTEDLAGHVAAFRTFNGRNGSRGGEYLFVPSNGESPKWVAQKEIYLAKEVATQGRSPKVHDAVEVMVVSLNQPVQPA